MKYIEGLMDDYTMDRDSAVTLGKFDGLHLGHQQLIRRICEKEKEGLESVVVTIWPDPKNPALLTKGEKKRTFKEDGRILVDRLSIPSGDFSYEFGRLCT